MIEFVYLIYKKKKIDKNLMIDWYNLIVNKNDRDCHYRVDDTSYYLCFNILVSSNLNRDK